MNIKNLNVFENKIFIPKYLFRPGCFSKSLTILASDIIEADLTSCTVLIGNEIIYLPDWPRDELEIFCLKHGIRTITRYDVWSDILAPYVDTSFTAQEVKDRKRRLTQAGFNPSRVFKLKRLIAFPIIFSQGIAGEWTSLHHYHLLSSLGFLRIIGLYGWAYRSTMKIALEGYGKDD